MDTQAAYLQRAKRHQKLISLWLPIIKILITINARIQTEGKWEVKYLKSLLSRSF